MRRETKRRIGLGVLVAASIGGIIASRAQREEQFLAMVEEAKKNPIAIGLREVYMPVDSPFRFIPRGLIYKSILGDNFVVAASGRSIDFYPLDTKEFEMEGHRYGVLEATEDNLKLSYLGPVRLDESHN